jgi:hypothetical protein
MPIKVTLEIIPHGDESRTFTAGTLYIQNDGTGSPGNDRGVGHYDWELFGPVSDGDTAVMNEFWSKGRLEGFDRTRGWWSCVKEVLDKAGTDYDYKAAAPAKDLAIVPCPACRREHSAYEDCPITEQAAP